MPTEVPTSVGALGITDWPGFESRFAVHKKEKPQPEGWGDVGFQFQLAGHTLRGMPYRTLMLAALVLAGCNKQAAEKPATDALAQRKEAVKLQISRGPEQRAYKAGAGELVVLDIPAEGPAGLFVETQRCYIWRDAEYRTATLSCPHQPEVSIADDGRDRGMVDNAN
jgi:hypothetical protein